MTGPMRLVIDMYGAQAPANRLRGVGRYAADLTAAMLARAGTHEVHLLYSAAYPTDFAQLRARFSGQLGPGRQRAWQNAAPGGAEALFSTPQGRAATLLREDAIRALNPDALLVMSLFEGFVDLHHAPLSATPKAFTTGNIVYDFTPLDPAYGYLAAGPLRDWYDEVLQAQSRHDLLFAISEATRRDAIRVLGAAPERVVTVHAGVDRSLFYPAPPGTDRQALRQKLGLGERTVFCYGGTDLHKNIEGLIRAIALAGHHARPVTLALAGKIAPDRLQALQATALSAGLPADRLRLLGRLDDGDLLHHLWAANVVVYPSRSEGFGLPVAEAMAAGAAVLCGDRTSLPEIIGRPDAMFPPDDPAEMARRIAQVLDNEGFARDLRHTGPDRAARFDWNHVADRIWAAFDAAHDRRQPRNPQSSALAQRRIERRLADTLPAFGAAAPEQAARLARAMVQNRTVPSDRPRLLVDCTETQFTHTASGIGRTVRQALRALAAMGLQSRVVPVYLHPTEGDWRQAPPAFLRRLGLVEGPDDGATLLPEAGDHFLALDLNYALPRQTAFLDAIRAVGGQLSAVVYDLLPMQRPDWFAPGLGLRHHRWFDTVAGFDHLACISGAVADAVRDELALTDRPLAPKVGYFHLGTGLEETAIDPLPAALAGREFVLTVSTLYARKGQEQLLDAFERLWAAGHDTALVYVGAAGFGVDRLIDRLAHHPENGRRLFWFANAPDRLLAALYAACRGVVTPSEGEGFGLPLVEALQRGCAVLARDLPVYREVSQGDVTWFTGLAPQDLEQALAGWIAALRSGTIRPAAPRRFLDWPESAAQLRDLIGVP